MCGSKVWHKVKDKKTKMRHIKAKAGVSNIPGDKPVRVLVVLFLFLVALIVAVAVPACRGGVAISGSFYAHDYVLAQGEEISSKDIYIVAFNKEDKRVRVDMEYESPEFIEVNLSSKGCFLNPDEYKRVYISLKAREDAVPGNYTVKVFAIIKEVRGDLPIKVLTSAAQEANVTVTGEYAVVDVVAIDPVGNIASTAIVRLFRSGYEVASAKGELKKRVVPGTYTAKAYLLGEEIASKEFDVAAYEEKRIELPIRAVYFETFDALPAKDESGRIGYVYLVAVIKNLYKDLPNVSVSLEVSGASSENFTIYSSPLLPLNRTEIKYNYIPKEGWKNGKYVFTEKVIAGDTIYAVSPVKTVEVRSPIRESLLLVLPVAVVIAVIIILYQKKRKRKRNRK